jgi:hypothetical protein
MMSCVKTTGPMQKRLRTTSTTPVIEWFTPWMPAIAMDAATAVLKMVNVAGNFRATPVVQTATVRTDKPSSASTIGALSGQTATDEYYFDEADFSLSALTAGKTFVRFGLLYDVSSVGQGQADVQLEVWFRQCGYLLPPVTVHVDATTADLRFIPLSGWLPTLGVVKVEGTIVITSLTDDLTAVLTYRTSDTSPEEADTWNQSGIGTPRSADIEENTGEQTVSTSNKALIQVGLMYSSSGTFGQADIAVAIGIRTS